MPRLAVSTLLALLLGVFAGCAAMPPTVFIVRHAEKAAGTDPGLTAAGNARARVLAGELAGKDITRVFSTDTRRTRATARPLAERLGLDVEIYDPAAPAALIADIRAAGETALIVGHSNTIGELAAEFGADAGAPVDEASEYDRLYVITLADDGVESEIRRYGSPASQ